MKRKVWFVIAAVHWLISLLADPLVFTCEKPVVYGVWKVLFLAFVIGFYQLAGFLIHEIRSGNKKVCSICKLSGIYFLVMLVFLLLTWPGIWRVDEFTILRTAKDLHLHYWQGYLTSVYYILCLMMIPAPVSVVLFMCLINSFVVGYLIHKLLEYTGGRKLAYLLYLPFLFFPVIDSNLYPMRMSIYAFLELLLLAKICFWKYEDRMPEKKELIPFLLLAGIVTSWRSESVYYIILFPVLLAVLWWNRLSKKQIGRVILTYLAFAVVLVGIQKVGEGRERGDGYELTAMVRPLIPLIVEAAYAEETDLIAAVDKVVNCAYIFQGASEGQNGLEIFWRWFGSGLMKDNYTREEYQEFKNAYYTLILRHPGIFLKERLQNYLQSTGILGDIRDSVPPSPELHRELRCYTYSVLELRSFEDYDTRGNVSNFVYSSVLPSLFLAAGVCCFLIKRRPVYAGSLLMVLLKVPLVFLTAPGVLFMYYYSPYLCGWIFLFFAGVLMLTVAPTRKTGG